MTRTKTTSIYDLDKGDVVIPHTAEYQEWIVEEIVKLDLRYEPFRITWNNGTVTNHARHAHFRVKVGK